MGGAEEEAGKMQPPPQFHAPSAAPPKRQKVILKPGHTLSDWYARIRTEKNLAGAAAALDPMGGKILRKITTEEVR